MRIAVRVYVYSMLVVITAIGLLGIMSVVKYESILTETLAKRLNVVTGDARNSIEKAGTVGVSLKALAQVGGPIDAAANLLPDDVSIMILDPRGDIVGRSKDALELPFGVNTFLDKITAKESNWHIRRDGYLVAGSTVVNSFGQPNGAVIAVQSDSIVNARIAAMLRRVAFFSFLTLIPSALIAAIVVYVSLRPLGRSIRAMRTVVEDHGQIANLKGPLAPTLRWFGTIFADLEAQRDIAFKTLDEIEVMANAEGRHHGK